MSYIFISYSHEDKEYAHRLEGELQRQRFDTWLDDRIDYGSQWPEEIEDRLDGCKVLILIMTPRSKRSEWVQNELNRAKRKKKKIYPLLLEGDEPWLSVEATQYVDVRDGNLPPSAFFDTLARVVPRKVATSTTTTNIPSGILSDILKDHKISPWLKAVKDLADKETPKKKKVDELANELILLKENNFSPSLENYQLKVGECIVIYRGFITLHQWERESYTAGLFRIGSDDHDEKFLWLSEDPQSELIQKLIDLGWSDNRQILSIMPTQFTPPYKLSKQWKKDTDSVAIANFLIDTNDLFSIEASEIKITRQKEK